MGGQPGPPRRPVGGLALRLQADFLARATQPRDSGLCHLSGDLVVRPRGGAERPQAIDPPAAAGQLKRAAVWRPPGLPPAAADDAARLVSTRSARLTRADDGLCLQQA